MATSGEKSLRSALARKYYRQMKAGYSEVLRSNQPSAGNDPYAAGRAVAQSTPITPDVPTGFGFRGGEPTNPATKLIDILTQPLYAQTQNFAETVGGAIGVSRGTRDLGDVLAKASPVDDYGRRNEKILPSDFLRGSAKSDNAVLGATGIEGAKVDPTRPDRGPLRAEEGDSGFEKALNFAGGLAADIAFDPLTYITLGTAGMASKVAGQGIRTAGNAAKVGKVAEPVAVGAERTGEALIKANDYLNALPGRGINAARRAFGGGKADDILDEIVPAPKPVPTQVTPDAPDNVNHSRFPDEPMLTERMLRNTETGEVKPYSAAEAKKNVVPKYDLSRVKAPDGRLLTPYEQEAIPRTNPAPTTVDDLLPEQAIDDAVEAQAKEAAQVAAKSVDDPIEPSEVIGWARANPDAPIEILVPGTKLKQVQPVSYWLEKLNSQSYPVSAVTRKAINAELNKAGQAGVRAQRQAAAAAPDVPPGAATLPTTGRTGAPATSGAGRTPSASEAAQSVREGGVQSRPWVGKPAQQKALIRKRYQRLLEAEHFQYLYKNQGDSSLTTAEKQKDFVQRLGVLARGKALDRPLYEEFYQKQIIFKPNQVDDLLKAPANTGPAKALNAALSPVTPASELMRMIGSTLEETAQREAARIYSGEALDEVSQAALRQALGPDVIRNGATGQQMSALNPEYTIVTPKQQTLRNSGTPGVGRGVNREAYNSKAQANMYRSLLDSTLKEFEEEGLKFTRVVKGKEVVDGYARAEALMERILPRLDTIETYLRSHGIEPIGGLSKEGIPVSLGDVFKALNTTAAGRDLLKRRIFGGAWGIRPKGMKESAPGTIYTDSLLRVMGAIINSLDATAINGARNGEDVLTAIARQVHNTIKTGKQPNDEVIYDLMTNGGKTPISTAKPRTKGAVGDDATGYPVDILHTESGPTAFYGPFSKQVIKELEDVLFRSKEYGKIDYRILNALAQTVQQRSAQHGIQFGDNVRQLSNESMEEVFRFLDNAAGSKEVVDALGDPKAIVEAVAKARPIMPSKAEMEAAALRLQEDLSDVISVWDIRNIEAFRAITRGAVSGDRQATNRAMNEVMEQTRQELNEVNPTPSAAELSILDAEVVDLTSVKMRAGLWVTNHFVPSAVMDTTGKVVRTSTLHEGFLQTGSLGRNMSRAIAKHLNMVNRMGNRDQIKAAYAFLQNGMRGQVDDQTRAIADELNKVNSMFFDAATNRRGTSAGILQDFFNRGYDLEHVADKMDSPHFGLPEGAKFDWDAVRAIADPREKIDELHRQWTHMNIDDPLDYLARLDKTIGNLATDVAISQGAWAKLIETGGISTAHKPGFVRLSDTHGNLITRYFPQKADAYFVDKAIIPELQKLDYLLKTSVTFNGGMGQAMRYFDPLLNMWKAGMTIWRPGHHMRNLVGDMSLSFLADGVKNPLYYYKAIKMLSYRKTYDGVDMLRMLQGLPVGREKATRYAITVRTGKGAPVKMDDDDFYEEMYKRGIIKDFTQSEDLMETGNTPQSIRAMQSALQAKGPLRGKGREVVGRVSEARDDLVRLSHALHLIENRQLLSQKTFNSVEEMLDFVAHRVNQVHPDGTDLAPFERKVMRRIMPFYSWMRKAIPLVIESSLQHPGRVTVVPKAMYNFGQQMGVDADNMSDPFPDDQLFPSWITGQTTGPAIQGQDGSYYGANPGFVEQDLMNEFLAKNPIESLLDMTNPFLKTPIELQTGVTLGQRIQTPGQDPLQYLGSQIPGISHAQSLAGVDVLGSVGTLAQGNGLDPTLAVQKGNREHVEENTILNFLFGVGAQNYSTKSAINSAEIEKRNKEKD